MSELSLEVKAPELVSFNAGGLLPEEINAFFNTLPFDLTFVDSENKVKYFTQNIKPIAGLKGEKSLTSDRIKATDKKRTLRIEVFSFF